MDVADIIKRLSKSQKNCLLGVRQSYGGEQLVNSSSNQNTRDIMESLGLISHSLIYSYSMVLTRRGLAVRKALMEMNDGS
jgi:hypothetical protein